MFSYRFPRPSVTADMLIPNENGEILLIRRKNPPYQHYFALPGGFIDVDKETIEECAIREAKEETNLEVNIERLIGIYSHPVRDPRGHNVTGAFLAKTITMRQAAQAKAGDDAKEILWINPRSDAFKNLELAFDHDRIIAEALDLPCPDPYPYEKMRDRIKKGP
jgi:8-oxo-dGTP diphosphatase